MLGTVGYILWAASFAAEVYIVVLALLRKDFLRYLSLNLFVGVMAIKEVSDFVVCQEYGFHSNQYIYSYYYGDAILTILMYLTIMHLYSQVFREMDLGKYVRWVTVGLLSLTALFSFLVVQGNFDHLANRFVIELSQDMYFVGLVLTYLLWAAVLKLRETRTRLVQLILALGVYFSATAATFALRNMFPGTHSIAQFMGPFTGALLPVAWAYTFIRVPADARLTPGRLMEGLVTHR